VKFREFGNLSLVSILSIVLVLSGSNIFSANAAPIHFPFGVESGDVTSNSAVLWTKVDEDGSIDLEVSRSPTFGTLDFKSTVHAIAANDYTMKTTVSGLMPNTEYYYRWRAGSTFSEVGRFNTAPSETNAVDVRFTWSGDTDPSKYPASQLTFGPWDVLGTALSENINFFIYLGDVIYSDLRAYNGHGEKGQIPDAKTLPEFREIYKNQKESMRFPNLNIIPIYALWDDHEVRSEWAGQTIDKAIYDIGRKSFNEYMPIQEPWAPSDSKCAGPTQFRVKHWGANVDLIILDTRSCRSDTQTVEKLCYPELAPTLPDSLRKKIRDAYPGVKPFISPTQPVKCLEKINDPTRTMLGATQKAKFKEELHNSKATFKFVISSVNMQQTYVNPYDNWEGYAAERSDILKFIRDNKIKNVIFLSTDSHQTLSNEVFNDSIRDSTPIAYEFVAGPIAALKDEEFIKAHFPPPLAASALAAKKDILKDVGADCFNLNVNSYGSVSFTQATKLLKITIYDKDRKVVSNEVNPAVMCTKTFGP
jgi:phosphodiesterase/alkaline phosphatase D-like protein